MPNQGGGPRGVWQKITLFPDFFRQPSLKFIKKLCSFLTLASLLCMEVESVTREVFPLGELDEARGMRALCHLCPNKQTKIRGRGGGALRSAA